MKGMPYLQRKLATKRARILLRYMYYDMKFTAQDFGIATPPELRGLRNCLGWCGKAVDSIANRLNFKRFTNDRFNISEIYNQSNPDVMIDKIILSALIASCGFIYIQDRGIGNMPVLQAIDGGDATGIIDPVTGMLLEGYAVLERDQNKQPTLEAYFTDDCTEFYKAGKLVDEREHTGPYALLVPVVFRPSVTREFGHSRISRSMMDTVNSAIRTLKRSEIAAEFYSYPQKWVVGTSADAEPLDKWKASMSSMLEITKDEDGDSPKFGQFTAASQSPHLDQLRMFAAIFAGEADLTMDDLGFNTVNPSASESIKAAHEGLRLTARKAQKTFTSGFLNAGFLAVCLRDNVAYKRSGFIGTGAEWLPIFEPDASALSQIGDGAIKINQAIPNFFNGDTLETLTGIKGGLVGETGDTNG